MTISVVSPARSQPVAGIELALRKTAPNPRAIDHPLATGRYQSPLRYPGAKSTLAPQIGKLVADATKSRSIGPVELLVEPFAGGASTSLRLLGSGIVRRALLADADPMVAAFWQAASADTENLIDRVTDEHRRFVDKGGSTALERWDYWRAWTPEPGSSAAHETLALAMKCLFLNRTTFSGILHGTAGPIGGRTQKSKYTIDCRFTLHTITERLRYVGHLYEAGRIVDVWRGDWRAVLDTVASQYKTLLPDRIVAYLDPPYLDKSNKLYRQATGVRSVDVADLEWRISMQHVHLAEYLRRSIRYRWVLSYDFDDRLLTDPGLYQARRMSPSRGARDLDGVKAWPISKRRVSLNYSASSHTGRGVADELLITTLPRSCVPLDECFRPV